MDTAKIQRENDFLRKLISFLIVGEFDQIKVDVARTVYCTIEAATCEHDWNPVIGNPNVQGNYSVCLDCRSVMFAGSDVPLLASNAFKLVDLKKIATEEYQRQMNSL